jgi:hypothetical protein
LLPRIACRVRGYSAAIRPASAHASISLPSTTRGKPGGTGYRLAESFSINVHAIFKLKLTTDSFSLVSNDGAATKAVSVLALGRALCGSVRG